MSNMSIRGVTTSNDYVKTGPYRISSPPHSILLLPSHTPNFSNNFNFAAYVVLRVFRIRPNRIQVIVL